MLRRSLLQIDRISVFSMMAANSSLHLIQHQQTRFMNSRAADLWKSMTSVSNQGSKKGRGRGIRNKDLNFGQALGDGMVKVAWPGLNSDITTTANNVHRLKVFGEDKDREKRLVELRSKLNKIKKTGVPPHERGFTGSSLNGKKLGAPVSYDDVDFSQFDTRIISFKSMIQHKSILGKKKTISVFAITGNGEGVIGLGMGKGSTASGALKLAKLHASQRLLYIDRCEGRTLFHNFYEEYYFTKVYAEKQPAGYGVNAHRIIKLVCKLIGLKDVYAKVEGSRNSLNVTKGFINGLLNQRDYKEVAKKKNKYVVEFRPDMYNFPLVLAEPPELTREQLMELDADRAAAADELSKNRDVIMRRTLDLYLFKDRCRLEKKKKLPFYHHYPSYKTFVELRDKDRKLQVARINRLKTLSDEEIAMKQYPLRPAPKVAEADAE